MRTISDPLPLRRIVGAALLASSLLALGAPAVAQEEIDISSFAAVEEPPTFDDPAAAVDSFKAVLDADDLEGLAKLLGLDPARLKSDDASLETFAKIREEAAKELVVDDLGDRKMLEIGEKLWPLPFPLVKGDDGKWYFDTYAGLEEIVNRRVGENELEAISTARAYVDAQQDYAEADHDGDGVLEYAQKLISTEGETDGLYWPTDEVNGESPAGDGIDLAELDKSKAGEGYFGYKFRILTGQGDNIAGGAYDYVINGNMIAGYALLAWPAVYGETGVKTFAVNQHGVVYETDLGEATEQIVKYIDSFNPDDTWDVVND